MQWLEAAIWWTYRAIGNVLEYVGFFGLVVFLVILLLNVSDWILEWEDEGIEKNTGD